MKYQDHSSLLLTAILTIPFLVFGAVRSVCHSSCEVANASNMTPTKHLEGESPTSVEVSIRLLSGEEITRLILEKPVTPKKLYSDMLKVEGYKWTNAQIYKLLNGTEVLNPPSEGEITLEKDNVINLIYWTLSQCLEEDNIKFLINHDHRWLQFIKDSSFHSDYFIMYFAVRENGFALQYAPNDIKTPELCLAAVQQNGYSIRHIPNDKKTSEVCLAAVQQNGYSIKYIPNDKKTYKVCLAAVQQNGYSIQYIPKDKKESEVCLAALQQNRHSIMFIHNL